jgi:hypothetical protein
MHIDSIVRASLLAVLVPSTLAAQDVCSITSGTGTATAYWVEHADTVVSRHTNLAAAIAFAQVVSAQTGDATQVGSLHRVVCPSGSTTQTTAAQPPTPARTEPPHSEVTPAEPPMTLADPEDWETLFLDDFESGDFGASAKGFSWSSPNRTAVRQDQAHSGTHALRFRFPEADPASDSHAEQRFRLPQVPELRIDYWLYVPDNYIHRAPSTGPSNNKFFRLWNGDWSLTIELARSADGGSGFRRFLSESETCSGGRHWPTTQDGVGGVIGRSAAAAMRPGTWNHVDIRYRASSSCSDRGRVEVRLNGRLRHALDWEFWADGPGGGVPSSGYLLGWANSGFDEETLFWVDDFRVSVPAGR